MAASEGTALQWQKVTGRVMVEGWGMSETCAIGTNNPVNATTFSGNIGLPLPSVKSPSRMTTATTCPLALQAKSAFAART